MTAASPKTRLRQVLDEHVVPAVGAYLGQVLVHHLGGRWLPRKKLLETGGRVGDRASGCPSSGPIAT